MLHYYLQQRTSSGMGSQSVRYWCNVGGLGIRIDPIGLIGSEYLFHRLGNVLFIKSLMTSKKRGFGLPSKFLPNETSSSAFTGGCNNVSSRNCFLETLNH